MIDHILAFSIRHRFLVIGLALAFALACVLAIYHTPVDAIPDLSENQVIVFTEWTGHSPREIEDQVTYPLSLSLQGLQGVRVVRSSSDVNFSMINVIFEDGLDLDFARRHLAERLTGAGATLPAGVTPRLAPDALATGQIFWYTVEGTGQEPGRLRALQDWYVRPQLQAVPGIAEVATVGGQPIEYHVELDPHRLRAYGVSAEDVLKAVSRSNDAVGGHVVQKANAEYLVRGVGWLGHGTDGQTAAFDRQRVLRDLEQVPLPASNGTRLRVGDVATVTLGPGFRRGVLEKDGDEVTGGVVLMRRGENPLEVTRRLIEKIQELRPGLPDGVRIVPFYDRTPLIEGAIKTVTGTLLEAMATAMICVLLVLLHWRTSFIIALILPLAAGAPFAVLWLLSRLGVVDVPTNIMSLAGIAISIGVLVDSAVVMAENVMHHLKGHFGERPVQGDVRDLVLAACRTVGRPIFFSVLIMLLSFLPVFVLGGMEGKMFRPLAYTKSLALLAAALLTITLVPALCTIFIRGRLRGDEDSWLVRSMVQVYRPVLDYLLARPAALVWLLGVTLVVGLAPLGIHWIFLTTLFVALVSSTLAAGPWPGRVAAAVSIVLIALVANQSIEPLGREFMTPLDEGMIMDMPITVPRASVTQSADDLKARDMILCRFPEVDMVVGKAGRAETPSDPAPLDMIETMVNFRPREFWPKRKLRQADAEQHAGAVLDALVKQRLMEPVADRATRTALVREAAQAALPAFEVQMREHAYRKNKEFERDLGPRLVRFTVERVARIAQRRGALQREPTSDDLEKLSHAVSHGHEGHLAMGPTLEEVTRLGLETARHLVERGFAEPGVELLDDRPNLFARAADTLNSTLGGTPRTVFTRLNKAVSVHHANLRREQVSQVDEELAGRAPAIYVRLVGEELLVRGTVTNPDLAQVVTERKWARSVPLTPGTSPGSAGHHHGAAGAAPQVVHRVVPALEIFFHDLIPQFAGRFVLWRLERTDLAGFGGELDRAVQMPGWTNVWTMPIQNRVDMLATGVNTAIGVRVLGGNLEEVVAASERVAAVVKQIRGAADVVADPVRGKGYLEVVINREKAARHGLNAADLNDLVETAIGGKVATVTIEGRERHPVRVQYARAWREDEEAVKNLPVNVPAGRAPPSHSEPATEADTRPGYVIPLSQVADVRIVEGPATIKSENGLLRNYVRLNVRDRDAADFVEEARRTVAREVDLPAGVHIEWTGQFEHDVHAGKTFLLILPLVVGLIFLTLYLTYHDLVDALLVMAAVLGAFAGGVFFQWWFGYKFSVTVRIGYIACLGMATSTGIIMLVYLREALAKVGGLGNITLDQLRQAVLDGAVHRLRPKLLTEGTTILGLAPVLWATGVGAEVIKPMAAPVLGGLLIADEVIDLFLPVAFYHVRRWRWTRLHRSKTTASPEKEGTTT
jgi:Cu(I)/Ag(I) efflux system membrane protein CusA/SilA